MIPVIVKGRQLLLCTFLFMGKFVDNYLSQYPKRNEKHSTRRIEIGFVKSYTICIPILGDVV
jgi:hypothetical protein